MTSRERAPAFTMPPPAAVTARHSVLPLWAVYIVAVLTGSAILVASMSAAIAQAPVLAVASAVLFAAFGGACAWLLARIPYFWPASRETRGLAMLWGATAATGYALLANQAIYRRIADQPDAPAWSLFAPFTEEPIKDLGIVVVLLLAATRPRGPLDGLVVGSFVGLGFEVVENVVQSVTNAITAAPPGHPSQWASLATDVIHEVLRRSWTGHIVITGIAGFGIAYAMTARRRAMPHRAGVAAALVLLAFAGHLLWNSHRFGFFYVLGQFGILAFYLWLIRVGRQQESTLYLPFLCWVAPALADPELSGSLSSATARRAYRKGTPSPGMVGVRQHAAARLAAALANGDVGRAHASAERLSEPSG
jgi:RsiW-degrading membrane proteinase PrsW (M82 family)